VVYTRDAGKVQLLAKGGRAAKNKFGAAFEPLTRGDYVFYWRENKELFTASEAAVVWSGRRLRETPELLSYGLASVEAVDKLSGEGDPDAHLYELLTGVLRDLDEGAAPVPVLVQFLARMSARLGFKPALSRCGRCGGDTAGGAWFQPRDGAVVCRRCAAEAPRAVPLGADAVRLLALAERLEPAELARAAAESGAAEKALSFLRAHLFFHTNLELKSLAWAAPAANPEKKAVA